MFANASKNYPVFILMQIRVSPAIINYTKLNKSYTCYNCFLLKSIIDLSALLSQLLSNCSAVKKKKQSKQPYGDVTRDDSQQRFLAQHSVAMLEQCCKDSKQCCNNVAMLCWAKNHRGESSRVTSLSDTLTILEGQLFFFIKQNCYIVLQLFPSALT